MLGAALLRIARTNWASGLIGRLFARHSRWLPIRRVLETDRAIAFWHPRPSYPVHVLIVPKHAVASLADLSGDEHDVAAGLVTLAARVATDLGLGRSGFRLIVNGGAFQDVKQLHLHLIADHAPR